ncbi:MAG TPA: hypothetical protein VII99_06190 [Bacteroidia bacterium]
MPRRHHYTDTGEVSKIGQQVEGTEAAREAKPGQDPMMEAGKAVLKYQQKGIGRQGELESYREEMDSKSSKASYNKGYRGPYADIPTPSMSPYIETSASSKILKESHDKALSEANKRADRDLGGPRTPPHR